MREDVARRLQNEQGQTMVEFALTILLTLTLVFGIIEFSRLVYTASILQWAAQAGARAAMVGDPVEAAALDRMAGLDTGRVSVTTTGPGADNEYTVELGYRFEFIVPLISSISGGDLELSARASMVRF